MNRRTMPLFRPTEMMDAEGNPLYTGDTVMISLGVRAHVGTVTGWDDQFVYILCKTAWGDRPGGMLPENIVRTLDSVYQVDIGL